jgi:hypothetical protein
VRRETGRASTARLHEGGLRVRVHLTHHRRSLSRAEHCQGCPLQPVNAGADPVLPVNALVPDRAHWRALPHRLQHVQILQFRSGPGDGKRR